MIALLGATAAAFVVTERLKLVPSPIVAPKVTEAISPRCRCATAAATVTFRLRDPDRVTVDMVDADGTVVGRPVDDVSRRAGAFAFRWSPADGSVPDGAYRARVHLAEARRTIVIPNEIRLDTRPPSLSVRRIAPVVFSPDGDGRSDAVHAQFAASERSTIVLRVDGREAVVTPPRVRGKVDWHGGRTRPGVYALSLVARDLAGNESRPSPPARVRLRYVAIAPRRVSAPSRVRFGVRVSTDAKSYRWRLGARRGTSRRNLLVVRAPAVAGRYTLGVSVGAHSDTVAVFVTARP